MEDYRREKRRRLIDRGREERLRALGGDTEDDESKPEDVWGGSDEEPDETQRELMRRTALHILNSPNAGQLEMRILANHGADRRFAFLKGRWSRAWKIAKGHVRLDLEKEKAHKADVSSETGGGLGGLTGYGDSDDEGTSTSSGKGVEGMHEDERGSRDESGNACSSEPTKDDDEIVKSARRARAKEWAEKRRALQPGARDSDS